MQRETSTSTEDRRVLRDTYEVMRRLQTEGRNHIWGYVARNLARPVWLASEAQKADIVIGNPPWLAYRHMKGDLQDRYKAEAISAKVWWTGRGTSANDLSAYFYLRAALLYMRREGRIALVMPYAAMSRQAYTEFRKGEIAQFGHVAFRLRFTAAWSFRAGGTAALSGAELRAVRQYSRRPTSRAVTRASGSVRRDAPKTGCR